MSETLENAEDVALVENLHRARQTIAGEIGKRVIGQHEVIEHLLITLIAGGHGLFVGVPGLAKTLLINTLAEVLELTFNRIQFTPDLMPSDITGTDIIQHDEDGNRAFRFIKGPVFCNILLADEINRTPPKTQAALLQSMQERKVTAAGTTYDLSLPFHVFATQNPIEQEGTYPLPEAQLDRFMMMMRVDYPTFDEETEVVRQTTGSALSAVETVLGPQDLLTYQDLVLRVPVADHLVRRAVEVVRRSRPQGDSCPADISQYVTYGAGPRAAQHLILAAKARAILDGRHTVDMQDLEVLAKPVMRHRIMTNFQAEANRVTADDLIDSLLAA
ncbi:MAG: MoxR family ATPase [Myxococcota bacterium]|nr:MoxR family ATPase [Myxococcota bacterium]